MPKWMPKFMTNIVSLCFFFSEKWNVGTYLFYSGKRGSGYIKSHDKLIQLLSKRDVGERHAKSMQNDANIYPKCEPKSIKHRKNNEERQAENNVEICKRTMSSKNTESIDPLAGLGRIFNDFWEEGGVTLMMTLTSLIDPDWLPSFQSDTLATPAGCGGFFVQNATLDAQGSIDCTFFDDFGKFGTWLICFSCRSRRQKVD